MWVLIIVFEKVFFRLISPILVLPNKMKVR